MLFPAVSRWDHPKDNPMGKWRVDALSYLALTTSALWLYRMTRTAMALS